MPYCTNCGEEVSPDARFCTNCGADMSVEEPASRPDGKEPSTAGEGDSHGEPPTAGQPQGGPGTGQPVGQGQQAGQPTAQHGAGGSLPQETSGGLDFAIGYPKRNGWTPTLISTVMIFLSFLIVPLFIVVGYGFRVARAAALGHPNPPEYDDWGGLIVDGLRFTAVTLVVGILAVVALAILFGTAAAAESPIVLLLVILLYLGFIYVLPAFQTAFVGSNSVGGALTDGRAISLLKSGYYAKAFFLYLALSIALSVVASIALITIVGYFVVYAYMILAFGAFWGLVYYRAAQRGIVPPPAGDQQPPQGQQPQGGQAPPRQPR